jgi:hypothetical protein
VSQTGYPHAKRFIHRRHDRRTVVEIQKKVVKQGKRNAVSRFVNYKNDKDKIAAWKRGLDRIRHTFIVCSIVLLDVRELNTPFQTELVIDATGIYVIIADIHRNMMKRQEGASGPDSPTMTPKSS